MWPFSASGTPLAQVHAHLDSCCARLTPVAPLSIALLPHLGKGFGPLLEICNLLQIHPYPLQPRLTSERWIEALDVIKISAISVSRSAPETAAS
jgi:hypothetical protein